MGAGAAEGAKISAMGEICGDASVGEGKTTFLRGLPLGEEFAKCMAGRGGARLMGFGGCPDRLAKGDSGSVDTIDASTTVGVGMDGDASVISWSWL